MAEGESFDTLDLEETFNKAANHLQFITHKLDAGQLLGFYGLYKQATAGPCNEPRPNWYQTKQKHKWEAWMALANMSRETAMINYIRAVGKVDPAWQESTESTSQSWVAVSRLENTDTELRDAEKTWFDWIKDGNEKKVRELISKEPSCVNITDENKMLAIHWAADRGHVQILKCLIEKNADKDTRDGDGQTALHYAASCGHVDAVEYLLSIGAHSLEDNDGLRPIDISDEHTAAML